MKGFAAFLKVLAALAAIGAAIYVGITYGDQIVAWVKKVLKLDAEPVCCCEGECCDADCCCEEAPAEAPAEDTVEAEDKDFEG